MALVPCGTQEGGSIAVSVSVLGKTATRHAEAMFMRLNPLQTTVGI